MSDRALSHRLSTLSRRALHLGFACASSSTHEMSAQDIASIGMEAHDPNRVGRLLNFRAHRLTGKTTGNQEPDMNAGSNPEAPANLSGDVESRAVRDKGEQPSDALKPDQVRAALSPKSEPLCTGENSQRTSMGQAPVEVAITSSDFISEPPHFDDFEGRE